MAKLDYVIMDLLESTARNIKAHPVNLGGISGAGGGVGGPPGGFIGWLPQTRVAYDESEVATSGTPMSGMSLLDNLNHIRYRLATLESGGGGGGITQAAADLRYLKLDASNDPLTSQLDIVPTAGGDGGIYISTTGDAFSLDVEQLTTNVNVTSPNTLLIQYTDGTGSFNGNSQMIHGLRYKLGAGNFNSSWVKLETVGSGTAFEITHAGHAYDNGGLLITDAPSDNSTYGRKNGAWITMSGVTTSGSILVVEEYDGSPSVSNVDKIIFSGATVTNLGSGDVLVTISGIPASGLFNDAEGNPADDVTSSPLDGTSIYAARRDHSHRDNLPPRMVNLVTPTWNSSPVNNYDTTGADQIQALVGPGTIELTGLSNGITGNYVYIYVLSSSTGSLLLKNLDGRSTSQFRLPGQQDMYLPSGEGILLSKQGATVWTVLGTTSGSLLQGVKVDPALTTAASTNRVLTYDGSKLTLSDSPVSPTTGRILYMTNVIQDIVVDGAYPYALSIQKDTGGVSTATTTSIGNSTYIAKEVMTEANISGFETISKGTFRVFFTLKQNSGTRVVTAYATINKVTSAGTVTLLATTSSTSAITGSYVTYETTVNAGPFTLDKTDRILVKIILSGGASGTDASVSCQIGNTDGERLELPTTTGIEAIVTKTGWIPIAHVWTRTGNYTFTVVGDRTAIYRKGTKVRYKDGGAYEYGIILSSSYSSPSTTVTLITNSDYAMAATTITDTYISYILNPEGFPTSFNYTPTMSRSGTNYTNQPSLIVNTFSQTGPAHLKVNVVYQQNATPGGTGNQRFTLPVNNANVVLAFAYNASALTQQLGQAATGTNLVVVSKYDGTAEVTASEFYVFSIMVEF